jgi:hypothetical protein
LARAARDGGLSGKSLCAWGALDCRRAAQSGANCLRHQAKFLNDFKARSFIARCAAKNFSFFLSENVIV